LAARTGAKARARRTAPKKLISMFARMSASVISSRLALGGFAPALLMRAVTSGAAATAAAIDSPSVTSRVRGTTRSSSQVRGVRAVA
jgi:tRNA U34 5-carboxymethylaminomethyl modifying enzyme MnmG/GidA